MDKKYIKDNLIIRSFKTEDMHRLWELSAKDEDYAWTKTNAPYFEEFKQMSWEEFEKEEAIYYVNKLNIRGVWISEEMIGLVSFYWESEATRWIQMGIVIHNPEYWGMGIGEILFQIQGDYLFSTYPDIERVGFTTWSGNPGMMRVGQKLGMRQEARIRKARYYKGEYHDSLSYGITREEWDVLYSSRFEIDEKIESVDRGQLVIKHNYKPLSALNYVKTSADTLKIIDMQILNSTTSLATYRGVLEQIIGWVRKEKHKYIIMEVDTGSLLESIVEAKFNILEETGPRKNLRIHVL